MKKEDSSLDPRLSFDAGPYEKLKYTPDSDLKIHEEGAIKLICAPFKSHENGIPEWIKNSSDAYARENTPESNRIVFLIFDFSRKSVIPSISCLDFVGMASEDIEKYFRKWADPKAAYAGRRVLVQGGHGNGGKCYMTQMFQNYSQVYTVRDKKRCVYGVPGGSIRFGYVPDIENGKDFPVADTRDELKRVLSQVRWDLDLMPKGVVEAADSLTGFSVITGFGPKGYENKFPITQLLKDLKEHPQMLRSIEFCRIYILVNGKLENYAKPLSLPDIKPKQGAEQPRLIDIPSRLADPVSGDLLSTTNEGKFHRGNLILYTSEKSMRGGMKARHTIRFRNDVAGDFGYVPISELEIQSAYRDNIYGICQLEALEQYKQNLRARLAESPLTRATERFIADEIQKYALEFETKDKRRYDQEDKNKIIKMNEFLDTWKNKLLNDVMKGLWGPGPGVPTPPQAGLPKGKPEKIELALSHQKAGLGVTFQPTLRYYDSEGRPIRAVPTRLISEDNNIAMADDSMRITTFSFGQTLIYAETLDSAIQSNKIPIEVVNIKNIKIIPDKVELEAGSRNRFDASCLLSSGERTSDVYLIWVEDNEKIAKVSSAGLVYAFAPGETTVLAGDNHCQSKQPALIKVLEAQGRGKGDKRGKGSPRVLISEFQPDPDTGEVVRFSSDTPPVWQRPEDSDRNIWWINGSAPLAKLYLDKEKGYGPDSREWRVYHLDRYIDAIVQIILTNGPTEKELYPVDTWIQEWGDKASTAHASAVSDLAHFVEDGEITDLQ